MADDVKNYAEMSDDDFEQEMDNVMGASDDVVLEDEIETGTVNDSSDDDNDNDVDNDDNDNDIEPQDGNVDTDEIDETDEKLEETIETDGVDDEGETEEDTPADTDTDEPEDENESPADENQSEDNNEGEQPEKDSDDDGKATLVSEILKPLKVSGKEINVKSLEDARNLMQQGVDYANKMGDIKPVRRVANVLKEAGIINGTNIDEKKLALIVDAGNGNKDAITELLKVNNIDPLDLDIDKNEYVSDTEIPTETDIVLSDVVEKLEKNKSYDNVVGSIEQMDMKSQEFFLEEPRAMLALEADIASGDYDKIMDFVQYERMNGRLGDKSDMEAYIETAKATTAKKEVEPQAEKVEPKSTKPSKSRRKAAGISKRAPVVKKTPKQYDYLAMPDEEFEKLLDDSAFN